MYNVDHFFYKIMLLIPLTTEMALMRGDNVLRVSWSSGY